MRPVLLITICAMALGAVLGLGLLASWNTFRRRKKATAEAVQRIPDAHCNGDMHAALEYARKVKHEHKEFMTEQSVQALY